MNTQLFAPDDPEVKPSALAVIESLMAEHGVLTIVKALLRALTRRQRRPQPADASLSDHMQRDIGLLPEPRTRPYWQLR